MLDNTAETPVNADTWIAQVTQAICSVWAEQAFHRPEDRVGGILALIKRQSHFDARTGAVANLIEAVAPRLARRGKMTDVEYELFLLEPLHAQLPFLGGSARAALAQCLVALHAEKLRWVSQCADERA